MVFDVLTYPLPPVLFYLTSTLIDPLKLMILYQPNTHSLSLEPLAGIVTDDTLPTPESTMFTNETMAMLYQPSPANELVDHEYTHCPHIDR